MTRGETMTPIPQPSEPSTLASHSGAPNAIAAATVRQGPRAGPATVLAAAAVLAGCLWLVLSAPAWAAGAWENRMAAADQAYDEGDLTGAEEHARQAVAMADRFDAEDPRRFIALTLLADLYRVQSRFDEAEPLYARVVERERELHGPDHAFVAAALVNQSRLYRDRGDFDEAERVLREALRIRETTMPEHHPLVAMGRHRLAVAMRAQGQYAEAEPIHRAALADIERALGPDHPQVAYVLADLAFLMYEQGRYDDAEPLYRRALDIREAKLEPSHPDVAASLGFMAFVLSAQGRHDEADVFSRRARQLLGDAASGAR